MKVLVAEDDAVLRRLLQNNLVKWGHEVVTAEDGEHAWKLFGQGRYPLVITDWMMPITDGLELVRRIRAGGGQEYTYILMLTAKSQKEDLVRGMEAGADDFVTKPFDRDELRVRLRAGERILSLHQELVRSESLASLGRMTEGIVGEIQEPVTFLNNNMATLRQDILSSMKLLNRYRDGYPDLEKANPALAEEISGLEDEINVEHLQAHIPRQFTSSLAELQSMRDLVFKLRDYARMGEGEAKPTDLNAALASLTEIVHSFVVRKKVRLETEYGEIPEVVCHPGKVNQAFLNLLMNAIQACEEGDAVRIKTYPLPAAENTPEGVGVEIGDTGSGIGEEHLAHIFEPFYSARSGVQSTGLGLSVTYGIVRAHGGRIDAESTEGEGSCFRIFLPVQPEG